MSHSWKPTSDTVLAGRTVTLTVADPDRDAADLFAALDFDDSWIHVRDRPTDVEAMAQMMRDRAGTPSWLMWTVRLATPLGDLPAGAAVGTTSYLEVVPRDSRGEIGFTVYTPPVWATTVNPECKLLLMGFAFEQLGWQRVELKTDIRNTRSQAAIAKLGAVREGILRQHMLRRDGSLRDTVMYSVVADEWDSVRAGLEARLR